MRFKKIAGIGYELYAQGADRISDKCLQLINESNKFANSIRNDNRAKSTQKKYLNTMKSYVNDILQEIELLERDLNNLEGYSE